MSDYHWMGLVVPFHRPTQDGRLMTNETKVTYRKLNFPVIWNSDNPLYSYEMRTVGFCDRVIVDSALGISAGIWLRLKDVEMSGMYWAQADFNFTTIWPESSHGRGCRCSILDPGPSVEVGEDGIFIRSVELIGFHLGQNPAYTNMEPIVITEEMLEAAHNAS